MKYYTWLQVLQKAAIELYTDIKVVTVDVMQYHFWANRVVPKHYSIDSVQDGMWAPLMTCYCDSECPSKIWFWWYTQWDRAIFILQMSILTMQVSCWLSVKYLGLCAKLSWIEDKSVSFDKKEQSKTYKFFNVSASNCME